MTPEYERNVPHLSSEAVELEMTKAVKCRGNIK